MNLLRGIILLGSLAIVTRAQRPLNTTTNGTAVLTDPWFVKPTSVSGKHQYVEQNRMSGSGHHQNGHESTGIRNTERIPPPPHPNLNTHLDIFMPPLNVVGGQQPAQTIAAPNNRVHKTPKTKDKVKVLRDWMKNSNATRNFEHGTIRKVMSPQPYLQAGPGEDLDREANRPPAKNEAFQKIKNLQRNYTQHTPPPPVQNHEDVDFDEKLGVKCSFEKPCAWTFDTNVSGSNFEVMTGVMLKETNVTGEF